MALLTELALRAGRWDADGQGFEQEQTEEMEGEGNHEIVEEHEIGGERGVTADYTDLMDEGRKRS
jgi:hypothetical protein